jgi:hypothetical protein
VGGVVLMAVFVATNPTHENSGKILTGATSAITSALATNGTVFPTEATNAISTKTTLP